MVGTQSTLLAALYKRSTDGTISAPLPMNTTAAATTHSTIVPLSHVLTEVQTVNVDNDARAFVFAPAVTLPLVQSAAMHVSIHRI